MLMLTEAVPEMAAPVVEMVKPWGPVPTTAGVPANVGFVVLGTMDTDTVPVCDAAAAGAAIAAAITGTLHAAPFTTARRSKLAFGAARLLISDIFTPSSNAAENPQSGKLQPSVSAFFDDCTQKSVNLQYQDALFSRTTESGPISQRRDGRTRRG